MVLGGPWDGRGASTPRDPLGWEIYNHRRPGVGNQCLGSSRPSPGVGDLPWFIGIYEGGVGTHTKVHPVPFRRLPHPTPIYTHRTLKALSWSGRFALVYRNLRRWGGDTHESSPVPTSSIIPPHPTIHSSHPIFTILQGWGRKREEMTTEQLRKQITSLQCSKPCSKSWDFRKQQQQ